MSSFLVQKIYNRNNNCLLKNFVIKTPLTVYTTRFPKESFGFWWATMSQSYFFVGLTGPIIANTWANNHGWRVAVQMPAVISMVVAAAVYFTAFEKPSDVGYIDQTFPGGG